MKPTSLLTASLLALSALALSACEGDARDLTEPVEASRLNLSSISIVPPSGSKLPLTVNPDEAIVFTLSGKNTAGQDINIDAMNRRWSVSDTRIATITDDGVFTGLLEDEVDIYVSVGGVLALPFTVDVSFGVLSAIGAIEGSASLQPCISGNYSTSGVFTDGSSRALDSVSWSVKPPESGSVTLGEETGSINLSGTTSGSIMLVATSNGISGNQTINIDNSLQSIVLRDGLSVAANGNLQLDARGSYAGTAEGVFTDISNTVAWSITQGADQATVSNASGNKGLVSGAAEGAATVQAACGVQNGSTAITVTPPVTRLVAEDGTDVNLSVGETKELRISTGTVYDETIDVTQSATWEVVGTDRSIVSLNQAADEKGEVTGVSRGNVFVRATYNGRSIDFDVDVN